VAELNRLFHSQVETNRWQQIQVLPHKEEEIKDPIQRAEGAFVEVLFLFTVRSSSHIHRQT
jgi:hypothetical protein